MATTKHVEMPVSGQDAAHQHRTIGKRLAAGGSLLGALAASSCCIAPLVLFVLGVSGAWIGNLTVLAPYQPLFIAFTLGCLGTGFFLVYRKPKAAWAEGTHCAQPGSNRGLKIALWSSTVLIAAAMTFPYIAPMILGV